MKRSFPRVAAIHDLSGFGKASLTVVMPILSSMGIQVCPLPTAILSAHTGFDDFTFLDLTDEMDSIIKHWQELNLRFDVIYSGFLGSAKQIETVVGFINDFRDADTLVVVDPVLGDGCELYSTMDSRMVRGMRELSAMADVITPNLTELNLLLDRQPELTCNRWYVKDAIAALVQGRPQRVAVTSVLEDLSNSVIAFDGADGRYWEVRSEDIPVQYSGTGDAFASVLIGHLLRGASFVESVDLAVQFCSLAIRSTFGHQHDRREGPAFEKVLSSLNSPPSSLSFRPL